MTEIALTSPESLASPQLRRGSWRACLGGPSERRLARSRLLLAGFDSAGSALSHFSAAIYYRR